MGPLFLPLIRNIQFNFNIIFWNASSGKVCLTKLSFLTIVQLTKKDKFFYLNKIWNLRIFFTKLGFWYYNIPFSTHHKVNEKVWIFFCFYWAHGGFEFDKKVQYKWWEQFMFHHLFSMKKLNLSPISSRKISKLSL